MIAVIAAVYLTAYLHSRRRVVFGILFAVAGIALAVATGVLAEEGWRWSYYGWGHDWGFGVCCRCASVPVRSRRLALVFARIVGKRSILPAGVITAMAFALPWLVACALLLLKHSNIWLERA